MTRTGLIVPVPAAEEAVGAHRAQLDRAAAWGVPSGAASVGASPNIRSPIFLLISLRTLNLTYSVLASPVTVRAGDANEFSY